MLPRSLITHFKMKYNIKTYAAASVPGQLCMLAFSCILLQKLDRNTSSVDWILLNFRENSFFISKIIVQQLFLNNLKL